MIGLAPQIGTAEAVAATPALEQKGRVRTTLAILAEIGIVHLGGIDDLVAQFGVRKIQGVHGVFAEYGFRQAQETFTAPYRMRQIAVLYLPGVIAIIAVGRPRGEHRRHGHSFQQFPVLLEERAAKIVVRSERKRIPIIRPPHIPIVNVHSAPGRKTRDDLFAVQRIPVVKEPFVPPGHPAHGTALRAPGGRRNLHLLVETKVIRFDRELGLAVLTVAGFCVHLFLSDSRLPIHAVSAW